MAENNLPVEKRSTYFYKNSHGVLLEVDSITGEIVSTDVSMPVDTYGEGICVRYDSKYADLFFQFIIEGKGIKEICKIEGMPSITTFHRWCNLHPEFRESVQAARRGVALEAEAKVLSEIDDCIDPKEVPGEKLRFEKLKWLARVNDNEQYGEKGVGGGGNTTVVIRIDTGIHREEDSIEAQFREA